MYKKIYNSVIQWEDWHWLAKYVPIMPVWGWYILKSRSLWFFTPSNPTLTFGGFIGETKQEMYKQLPLSSYPTSIYITPSTDFNNVKAKFIDANLNYPVAVKPDAGMMGLMFRKIESEESLKSYHFAISVDYIIQEFIDYPLEVSVFYYRYPDKNTGTITGFLKKEFLQVTGDGKSTLLQLMLNYSRLTLKFEEMKLKHDKRLGDILPKDFEFCLSPALNLSRGGKLINLEFEKDEKLLQVFDDLSNYTNSFFYGRYDIKCMSIEELKEGKNYSILEYNGSGAEPHHVYGNGNTIFNAYQILLHHWKVLYEISAINHKNGIAYWGFMKGLKFSRAAKLHFKKLNQVDNRFNII
jgi:hypothetical protein